MTFRSGHAMCRSLAALIAALSLAASQRPAAAADLFAGEPILRGSLFDGYARWDGFYIGGHAAYTSGGADFGNATQPLIAFILRNTFVEDTFGVSHWTTLGKADANSASFGGFAGYDWQWDDVVLGLELNYTKTNWTASSTDSIARRVNSGTQQFDVTLAASSSLKLIDYTSIRGRAGWATGQFMPYVLAGFVVGRADIMKSATVTDVESDTSTTPPTITGVLGPLTQSDNQDGKFIYGYSGGLGVDVALASNIFLRGEYEYIQFFGLGGINLYLHTLRAGLGIRF